VDQSKSIDSELNKLSQQCWEFRRTHGYLKSLPNELRQQAIELLESGIKSSHITKSIGVPAHTLKDWKKSLEKLKSKNSLQEINLAEVKVVDDSVAALKVKQNIAKIEIKLSTMVSDCHVEILGVDFTKVQTLLRKLQS
jgi:hypothetical protein